MNEDRFGRRRLFWRAELRFVVMTEDDVLQHIDELLWNRFAQRISGRVRFLLHPHHAFDDVADQLPTIGV